MAFNKRNKSTKRNESKFKANKTFNSGWKVGEDSDFINLNLDGENKKKTSVKGKFPMLMFGCDSLCLDFEYLKFLNDTIMKDDVLD